jgi:uncharacterized glyoxalase superfamily protein PhnB
VISSKSVSEIRIMIYPGDLMLSRQFYTQLFQWPIQTEWDEEDSKGIMFDTGSGTIELLWERGSVEKPANYNLSMRVVDVWSLWPELSRSATVVFALRQNPWGDDSFCIADPDGCKLTFFTDRPAQTV